MLRKNLANILTILNLLLGLLAIAFSLVSKLDWAMYLILIAALTDRLDGLVARKLNIVSSFGKYLDSNSDLVSFGVAPALMIYVSLYDSFNIAGFCFFALFVIGGAWRLAKYNATEFDGYYRGIPITIAGAVLAISYLLHSIVPEWTFWVISLILSYAMVSTIKFKKR